MQSIFMLTKTTLIRLHGAELSIRWAHLTEKVVFSEWVHFIMSQKPERDIDRDRDRDTERERYRQTER